jgi:hypothetical protein
LKDKRRADAETVGFDAPVQQMAIPFSALK